MALWIENKGPPCFLLLWGYRQLLGQQQHKRQLDAVVDVLAVVDICRKAPVLLWTGAWPIPAYDKPELARPPKIILRRPQITEDDLPGPGRFRLMTSRNWPGPGKSSSVIWGRRKVILLKLPKVIFRGQAIPACPKPELIGIFKLTFRGLKNPGKWLWLDKFISEILKPLKLVLCSSRETVSLKKFFKTCRVSSLTAGIEWVYSRPPFQMAGQYL